MYAFTLFHALASCLAQEIEIAAHSSVQTQQGEAKSRGDNTDNRGMKPLWVVYATPVFSLTRLNTLMCCYL